MSCFPDMLAWMLVAEICAAAAAAGPPIGITAIAELDTAALLHTEVLQVRRDFGSVGVNVALDAWTARDRSDRIDAVRMWWSDDVDRYPFSAKMLERMAVEYRRVAPERWRVGVGGEGKRVSFDVTLHEGKPAAFVDVEVQDGRVVRNCRAASARLHARRMLGIPIGLKVIEVTCTAPDGNVHRGSVPMRDIRRLRPTRRRQQR